MLSVENTNARAEVVNWSICFARSMAISPAEHPIPERLYTMMLDRMLKWLMIMDAKDGVGLKRLQLTTKISMASGVRLLCLSSLSIVVNITAAASSREDFMEAANGELNMAKEEYGSLCLRADQGHLRGDMSLVQDQILQ